MFSDVCSLLEKKFTEESANAKRDVDTMPRTKCADLYAKVDSLGLELRNKLHGAAASELDGKADSLVNKLDKKIMSSGGEAGV